MHAPKRSTEQTKGTRSARAYLEGDAPIDHFDDVRVGADDAEGLGLSLGALEGLH